MKKKYIPILIILLLLICVPLALAGLNRNDTQKVSPDVKAPVPTTVSPSLSLQKGDPSNFSTVQDTAYTLSYPKTWTENKSQMVNKKGIVYLLQPTTKSTSTNPHITVEVVDSNLDTIAGMTSEFSVFGYKTTTLTINGVSSTHYERTLASSQGTLHSSAYIYEKNGSIYLFKLGYTQNDVDTQLEDEFTQTVANFSVN